MLSCELTCKKKSVLTCSLCLRHLAITRPTTEIVSYHGSECYKGSLCL